MKLAELKSEFHSLIDSSDNQLLIEQFYNAMIQSLKADGSLWQSLTDIQKQGVLDAHADSDVETNLVPFEQIKAKYDKWS